MVNANDYGPSHSNNIDKNNGKAGNGIDIHSGRSKVQNVMKMNARKGSRIHSNYSLASKQIFHTRKYKDKHKCKYKVHFNHFKYSSFCVLNSSLKLLEYISEFENIPLGPCYCLCTCANLVTEKRQ